MASPASRAAQAARSADAASRLARIKEKMQSGGRPGRARALTTPGRAATQIQETVRAALQETLEKTGVTPQDFEGNVERFLADGSFVETLRANVERRADRTGQTISDDQLVQSLQPEELKAAVAGLSADKADKTSALPDDKKEALNNPRRPGLSEKSAPQPTRSENREASIRSLQQAAKTPATGDSPKKAKSFVKENDPDDFATNDMPQSGRPTEEVSGAIPEGSAPLDPGTIDNRASQVDLRFQSRTDGPTPGVAGRAAGQRLFPADNRPRDPDTDNIQGPRKNDPAQIRTTRDSGPTDQYRVVADGTLNNMRVVSEETGESVAGNLARLSEGRFLFQDGDGRVFLFEDVTQGPRELGELDLRLLSREPGFAPEPVAGGRSFAPEEVISDEVLTEMVAELGPFSSPGEFPPSLNLQTFRKTLDEIDLLAATDSAKLQEILGRVFEDPEDAATALFNARSLRDELLKDPSMLQMVDGKAVNLSAESPGGSVPPTEIVGRAPGGAQTVTVEGRSYVLDDAGYADLNRLKADTQQEISAIETLLEDARGISTLPPTGVESGLAIDFSDPSLMARLEREGGPLGEAVESLKEAVSLGRPTQAIEVARNLEGRLAGLRTRDSQIDRAFMGPGETGEALEDFGPGQRPIGARVAVNPDGSIERLDGRDPRDGRPTIEILSNPNPPDNFLASRQAMEADSTSTMPPTVSNVRTLMNKAFSSRGVQPPQALARVLETRPRGSRVPSEQKLQALGKQIEAEEEVLRSSKDPRARTKARRELKRLNDRVAAIADASGGDVSSATVAAEEAARAEKGWSGTTENLLRVQLGLDASGRGGARAEQFRRLDPSAPEPADATPAEIAARRAIAESFGADEFAIGAALESVVTGRTRPDILNKRERTAAAVDTTEGRLRRVENTPKPGVFSRLLSGLSNAFAPGGALAPPGMTGVPDALAPTKKAPAAERAGRISERLGDRLARLKEEAAAANTPLVNPGRITEAIEGALPNRRDLPRQKVVPLEPPELGDTGLTEGLAAELESRQQSAAEAMGDRFSGSEDAEPVGIGPREAPRAARGPSGIMELGEEIERLREQAGGTQEFADLEYLWTKSLGEGNPKAARATSASEVKAVLNDANRLIEAIELQLDGNRGVSPATGSPSLRSIDVESYEDAVPLSPRRIFFQNQADADFAAAALRGETPLPEDSPLFTKDPGTLEGSERRRVAADREVLPDFRPGRELQTEFFEKSDGETVMQIGIPVKAVAGGEARTMFVELPVMRQDALPRPTTGKTRVFEVDVETGGIKQKVRDGTKISRRELLEDLPGLATELGIEPSPTASPQQRSRKVAGLQGEVRRRTARGPDLDEAALRQGLDRDFYDEPLELEPGETAEDYGIAAPVEEARPVPRREGTQDAPQAGEYAYEGTPFATDEEFYDNAPANRLPDNTSAPDRVRELRKNPQGPDAPPQVPGGSSPAARRLARRGLLGAAVAFPFLTGAASKDQTGMDAVPPLDPAEYDPVADINAGEPVRELTARERIANRLAELRGTTSRRRPLRYGTTQLYTPNWN